MKPKTKQQERVYSLSMELSRLEKALESWAFETCIEHRGYKTKTAISCLSCGHIWKTQVAGKKEVCPACKRKLVIENSLKKKLTQLIYFAYLDVCEGFQVNRYFQMYVYHKAGTTPRIFIYEIVQQWMEPNGKNELIARNRGGMGLSSDNFHGYLEIRNRDYMGGKLNVYPSAIHPDSKWLPIYKRNGFKGECGISSPYDIFSNILSDSKAETLLKAKQYGLLDARLTNRRTTYIDTFWNSIKICIRNNYVIKDAITWLDYLDLLNYFNKDLNSPKYICPKNLKQEHDKLVAKKRQVIQREEAESKRKRAIANQAVYIEAKRKFFGLLFSDGDLSVKFLESVQEFIEEGDAHKHCVFTNEYYAKEDSLIFSARIDGKPVETVELSLLTMKIIQSRGIGNRASIHNERIVKLMKKNLQVIKKRCKEHQVAA